MPDWLAILKAYVDTLETIVGTEGGVALANKLTAARAALLDQITALRLAELDAGNIPTDLANIIAYVDLIDDAVNGLAAIKAEVEGLAGAAMRGTDNAALAASWTAALATALGNYTAAKAAFLDVAISSRAAAATALSNATWTDAKAGYLTAAVALASVCTEARLAELAAANLPADIDTLLVRLPAVLSAARIGFLDNINQAGLLQVTAARAALLDQITALRLAELDAGNIPTDLANIIAYVDLIDDAVNGLAAIKAEVEGLAGAAMRGTDGAALAASWTAALATALGNYTALRAGYLDNINQAGLLQVTAARAALLDQITAARLAELDAANIPADTDPRVMGRLQIAATTIDLNQVAGTYDLFTGTTQDVVLEKLVIRMPNIAAGGAITSISIQTDDTTPQVIISAADGVVANLTAEAQLAWTGAILIDAGTGAKIRLTIAGGAHGVAYVCDVIAECRAVVSGGYLA